jgi:hypothetical protein
MMKAIKKFETSLKNSGCQKPFNLALSVQEKLMNKKVLCLMLVILCAANQNVWAVGNDTLSAGVTAAETILTGSMMRLIVIAGSIFGVIKAYMASSPLLMGGSIAIGIGINLLMTWVQATWAILI